jgi:hypothetical protein
MMKSSEKKGKEQPLFLYKNFANIYKTLISALQEISSSYNGRDFYGKCPF